MTDPLPTQQELDAARRLSEAVNLHLVADQWGAIGKVVVVKLEDGSLLDGGALYDTWEEARNHVPDARWYAPLRITPDGINERDARLWMRANKLLPGVRILPTSPEHVVSPRIFLPGGRPLNGRALRRRMRP